MPLIASQQAGAPSDVQAKYVEDAVLHHPFCTGLTPGLLRVLLQCAALERYPAHQLVFSEGSDADRFYLVHKGQMELELFVPGSGVALIQSVNEGEACGISALFGMFQWSFSGQTTQPSELLAFAANTLQEHIHENPEFEHDLMARVAPILFHRLKATRQRLIEFYGRI